MSKAIVNKNKITEVLSRGVEIIYPNRKALEKVLLSGRRLRIYCGFDPSAPSLHIGNAILINKLSQFQEMGHEVIFLIGDFTGMIGDPTDKASTRKKLSRKEALKNAKDYQKQASEYLRFDGENPAKVKYNSQWCDKLTFKDLIELSSHFTVQQMIQRDMFQERLRNEKPIHLHEFLYPLMQGYDSVAMDVDLEIGGNDQMFNMMAGRDLMKSMGKKEKFVLTLKLLVDDKGKKMGKSEGNVVFLNQKPEDIYGGVMSWTDKAIGVGFELCTKLPMEEVNKICEQLKSKDVNPRDLKMKLAFELVKIIHGLKKARLAQEYFVNTIQKKQAPNKVKSVKLKAKSVNIAELLTKVGLASSKGEVRRLIAQGGVKVDGQAISDFNQEIKITKNGILLQRGKRHFIKVFY